MVQVYLYTNLRDENAYLRTQGPRHEKIKTVASSISGPFSSIMPSLSFFDVVFIISNDIANECTSGPSEGKGDVWNRGRRPWKKDCAVDIDITEDFASSKVFVTQTKNRSDKRVIGVDVEGL